MGSGLGVSPRAPGAPWRWLTPAHLGPAHPRRFRGRQAAQQGTAQPQGPLDAVLRGEPLSVQDRWEVTQALVHAFLDTWQPARASALQRPQRQASQQQTSSSSSSGSPAAPSRPRPQRRPAAPGSNRTTARAGGGAAGPPGGGGGSNEEGERATRPATPTGAHNAASSSASSSRSAAPPGASVIDRAADHLSAGGFDEALLGALPTAKLNWVIKLLGRRRRLDLAEQLFHWMRLKRLANEHSFVQLCEACEACGDSVRALQAWRNTRRMQAGFTLGPHAAAALMKVYRSRGDLAGGLALLAELERTPRLELNQYPYNIALRMCADVGELGAALRLLGRMRGGSGGGGDEAAAAPAGRPVRRRVATDQRTYGALLSAVKAAGAWNRAAAVHRWLREDGVALNMVLGAQLLDCYAGSGSGAAAEGVMQELAAVGVTPNRTHWNALISTHAEAGDWRACQSAYSRMLQAGLVPDTYSVVSMLRGLMYAAAAAASGRGEGLAAQKGERPEVGRPQDGAAPRPQPGAAQQQQQQQQQQEEMPPAGEAEIAWLEAEMRQHRIPLNSKLGTALMAYWLGVARGWQPPDQPPGPAQAADGEGGQPLEQQQPGGTAGAAAQAGQRQQQQHALAQATAVWKRLQGRAARARAAAGADPGVTIQQGRHAQRAQRPPPALDTRCYKCFMEVQLAAGDWRGVLRTLRQLEQEPEAMPDEHAYRLGIRAAAAAGLAAREAELRQLLASWRLLHGGG